VRPAGIAGLARRAGGKGSTVVALEPLHVAPPETDSWMDRGACKSKTHLFFPPRAERPQARVRRENQARLICASCPVLEPCRAYARANHEYGFWGGESEEERHLAGFTVAAPIGVRNRSKQASRPDPRADVRADVRADPRVVALRR
jgi:WhiB family redox-sensing transcriptional regulator